MEDTTIEDVLKTFEDFYVKKDYSSALSYLQKHENDVDSDLWHYNMGTAYAQTKNLAEARFHFIKAEDHGFASPQLIQNKSIVETELRIDKWEAPLSTVDYLVKGGMFASQGILTSFTFFILVLALVRLKKKASLNVLGIFAGVMCLILGLNWWILSWPKSVVVSPQQIFEGPSKIFAAREELPVGILLITTDEGDWRKVIYPSRFEGWIKKTGLKELN